VTVPSQIFSVYNYRRGQFDYYDAPLASLPSSGHFRTPRASHPESVAALLPDGASRVGSGVAPKGIIATLGDASAEPARWTFLIGSIAAVSAIVWIMSPKKRSAR